MAKASGRKQLIPTDIMYFLTFALGMAAFWLSGKASSLLPLLKPASLSLAASMIVTALVYGLILVVWSIIFGRRGLKGLIIGTLTAIILGIGAAQLIVRLAAGHINTPLELGLLTFALYLCYGLIYVASMMLIRKFSPSKSN